MHAAVLKTERPFERSRLFALVGGHVHKTNIIFFLVAVFARDMSRNDVILVIRSHRRYYVAAYVNADTEWNVEYARRVVDTSGGWVRSRARALVLAHDMQRRDESEYGVRELRL
jgi:hypothetical protein